MSSENNCKLIVQDSENNLNNGFLFISVPVRYRLLTILIRKNSQRIFSSFKIMIFNYLIKKIFF